MTPIQSFWLSVSLVIGAFLIIEPKAVEAIELLSKIIDVEIRRRWLMLKLHPKNPITNWIMARKMSKLAKQLHQELSKVND